ncbi:hypothetical protein [Kitasatospora viridis]|uniref:Acyl carrier protein n=1 Tax=Kitasatospora viridis TaxID=281105 RepID=A0A561UBZ5_9ACTN|nr:hypothetical protein [Kitasatospora viridis]TWF96887.1 hypothetical protein FHX73_11661 [Kitasatospora viridis]
MIHGTDTDTVAAGVFAAVSAASDFPTEVLTHDQSLANDLDFDSLMFAELADRLVLTWPGLPLIDKAEIRAGTTIGDVIGWVRENLAEGAA